MFAGEIPEDSIQVIEACHVGNECMVEVQFPEGKHLSSVEVEEANAVAIMHRIGKHAALVSILASSPRGYVLRYQVRVLVVLMIIALLMIAQILMRRPSLKKRPSMRRNLFSNSGLSSVRASNLTDS